MGGLVKGASVVVVAAIAVTVGLMKAPGNFLSMEIVDAIDAFLDGLQGSLANNKKTPHLSGIFAPTFEEHNSGMGLELEVLSGKLPEDLDGIYFKIGPNLAVEPRKQHHVFDGDGMLHNIRIKGGKAHYHNAFLQTPRLKFQKERGRQYFPTIGEISGPIGLIKVLTYRESKIVHSGLDKLEVGPMNTAVNFL